MGWYSSDSPYHQVEMVDLRDAGKRKVLTTSLLEKPRDILIDMHYGFDNVKNFLILLQARVMVKFLNFKSTDQKPRYCIGYYYSSCECYVFDVIKQALYYCVRYNSTPSSQLDVR